MKLFSATWCTPCTSLKEIIKNENLLPEDSILDVDRHVVEARRIGIRGVPALQVTEDRIVTGVENILTVLRGSK